MAVFKSALRKRVEQGLLEMVSKVKANPNVRLFRPRKGLIRKQTNPKINFMNQKKGMSFSRDW